MSETTDQTPPIIAVRSALLAVKNCVGHTVAVGIVQKVGGALRMDAIEPGRYAAVLTVCQAVLNNLAPGTAVRAAHVAGGRWPGEYTVTLNRVPENIQQAEAIRESLQMHLETWQLGAE